MKARVFIDLISELERQAKACGSTVAADQLNSLAELVRDQSDSEINMALTNRLTVSAGKMDVRMRFGEAIKHLLSFRRAAAHVARKADIKSLDAAITTLNSDGSAARVANEKRAAPAKTRDVLDSQQSTETAAAREILERLRSSLDERTVVEGILENLRSSPQITLSELNWIAQNYSSTRATYPTRSKAIARIRSRFETIAQRESKRREIDRITEPHSS